MNSRRQEQDGNREWAQAAKPVGNVTVGWRETPEKLGRQASKTEGVVITVVGAPQGLGENGTGKP